MEPTDKYEVHAEALLQVSQHDSHPAESDVNQDTVLSTVSATFPVLAINPTHRTNDYNILHIKREHKLPSYMHEDIGSSQKDHSCGGCVVTGLQSVKCEKQLQELNEQHAIIPLMDTDQSSTWTCDVNDIDEVKPNKITHPDEYIGNSDETRHWVVCPGGVLKEVKAEHTVGVSELLSVHDGNHDVDKKQYYNGTNHAKMECESQLNVRVETHMGVKPFTSTMSEKSVIHPSGLETHQRTQTLVKSYICDTCGKVFGSSSNLQVHERIHTGLKPYTCDTCGKSFTQSNTLKHHERTHIGMRPHTCDTCGKSFTQSSALTYHERTHTGVKPYTCDTCGKSFTQSSSLRVHERIHTGVKPFACDTCGKSFARLGGLKRHKITHTQV